MVSVLRRPSVVVALSCAALLYGLGVLGYWDTGPVFLAPLMWLAWLVVAVTVVAAARRVLCGSPDQRLLSARGDIWVMLTFALGIVAIALEKTVNWYLVAGRFQYDVELSVIAAGYGAAAAALLATASVLRSPSVMGGFPATTRLARKRWAARGRASPLWRGLSCWHAYIPGG